MTDRADISAGQSSCAHKADRALHWSFAALFFFLPIGTSPVVIAGILALAVWVFSGKILTERKRLMGEPWFWPLVLFIALPWIGLLWTPDLQEGLSFASKTYYYLLAFAIASLGATDEQHALFIRAFLAGLAVTSVFSILQLGGIVPVAKNIPTFLQHKRILGSVFLVVGIAMLAPLYASAVSARTRFLLIGVFVLFLFTLGMSGGRSGYVALIIIAPLMIVWVCRKVSLLKTVLAGLLIVVVLFAFGPFRERLHETQIETASYQQGNVNTGTGLRLYMWKGAVNIFLENPIVGAGTGGYRRAMQQFETSGLNPDFRGISNPHNSYLYMAASFGLFGIVSVVWLFYVLLRKGWQGRFTPAGFFVLVTGVALFTTGFVNTQIIDLATANILALAIGMQVNPHAS